MEEKSGAAPWRGRAACIIAAALLSIVAPAAESERMYPNIQRGEGSKIIFDVRPNRPNKMIQNFIYQSGVQIAYGYRARMHEQVLTPVIGEYEPVEAVRLLFSSTHLVVSVIVTEHEILANVFPPPVRQAPVGHGPDVADNSMLVTGSHIRNVLDIAAPLLTLNKEEIDRAGTPSVAAAVQQLPANMGSPFNEHFGGTGNFGRGTALNLRGLGAGATLVLVNGRRQPQAGLFADFVDVSNIPWSIVERIEVLPDGSSAVYGSDAIAGVVNIILRDDLDGAQSQLRVGASPGGTSDLLAAQLFGQHWSGGHWLGAYQYLRGTALAAADRPYSATADKRAFGGQDYRTVSTNPGNILDPITFEPRFAIPAGQDGRSLEASQLIADTVNLQNQYADYQLLPNKEAHSVFLTGAQALTSRIKVFGEGRLNHREISFVGLPDMRVLIVPRTNAFFVDPFGGESPFVPVAYNFLHDLGPNRGRGVTRSRIGTVGAEARLRDGWLATLSGMWGRESLLWRSRGHADFTGRALAPALADSNPSTAFNPFGAGSHTNPSTLDAIQLFRRSEAISTLSAASFNADGPLIDLPGGDLKAAVGLEGRIERLDRVLIGRDFLYKPQHYRRSIAAAFTQLAIPLIGNPSDAKAVPRLQASLAARYEDYSDFGHTANPKISVQWAPSESFKLRGSWGTSFKAPKLVDLYDVSQNIVAPVFLPDSLSPTGKSWVIFREGSNPDLREETARTWAVGLDLAPPIKSKFVFTLNAYVVEYRDQVFQPFTVSQGRLLLEEARWREIITRSPSADLLQSLCTHPDLMVSTAECLVLSPSVYIDGRMRNMATTRAQGLDLDISHSHHTSAGVLNFSWSGHYMARLKQALTASSPASNLLDTVVNPLRLKLRGTAVWSRRADGEGFGAQVSVRHLGGYKNPNSTVRPDVASLTMIDLSVSFRPRSDKGWWRDADFVLSATNVFDRAPSFVDSEVGYDPVNMEPHGRNIGFHVNKSWGSN